MRIDDYMNEEGPLRAKPARTDGGQLMKTPKRIEAEATLPAGLQGAFDALVTDYMDASGRHTRDKSKRVNYKILADLIRAGWRRTESPI